MYAGNVALKSSEGVAQMIVAMAKKIFMRNWYSKLIALLAKPMFKELYSYFDTNSYNGGSLLGLRGVVIKSHGSDNAIAFATAIRRAIPEIAKDVPSKIKHSVAEQLENCESTV